jgi:protein phosphatase
MRVHAFGRTDIGRRRKINQDAFLVDEELGFFVVADGMGGHAAGEVASKEAVSAIHDMIVRGKAAISGFKNNHAEEASSNAICRLMESSVQFATYLVYGMAEQKPGYHGMGTTVSALLIVGNYAITAQVGDSRIYRIRNGKAEQLTEDHTLVNWQVKEGVITPEEAEISPHKNVITRAVGNKDFVQVDTQIVSVLPGDQFLICSDGLHGYVNTEEISTVFSGHFSNICDTFINMANERGGKDNITTVAIELLD